jgi:hypothetical protein
MKNIFLILLFIFCNTINAQKLSDYKYVYVSKNIKNFENNKYNLTSAIVKNLETKGYKVLETEQNSWPKELIENPCEVAVINIIDSGNFFKNKLTFEAKDCHDKIIFTNQGISGEKDFDLGFNEALKKSLTIVPSSSPIKNLASVSENQVEKTQVDVEKSDAANQIQQNSSEAISTNNSQNFTNGNLKFQKILIGNGDFILVSANSSVPFATFKKSFKEDVFHVVLENGSMTLGYLENGNYVIEMPNKDGSFTKEIFEKK